MSGPIKALLFLAVFALPLAGNAQKRADLEKKRDKLDKQIKYTNELLNETQTNQRITQTELALLNKKIAFREELINNIGYGLNKLDQQISENYAIIEAMEADLEALKQEYAKMIYFAYKNTSPYDRLLFVFASESFDQGYKRLKYIQQYTEYRKRQAAIIQETRSVLSKKIADLEVQKNEKESLLGIRTSEKKELSKDKESQQKTYKTLKEKERELERKYKTYLTEKKKIDLAIRDLIAKESEKVRGGSNSKGFALTPLEKELAKNFEANKGKLPWPVERGQYFRKYGKHQHPVLPEVYEDNKGVDIITNKGAYARAIFDGTVSAVIIIPGAGKGVMVRHGNYYSVYTNLGEVYVKKGDQVSTKERIGKLITDEANERTESHLEIWKISADKSYTVDPAQWILKL